MLPLESVPNFSEGRDRAAIDAIGEALGARARVLDLHVDADHNRSVFTLVGSEDELVDALVAGVEVARDRIDLRAHAGVHPRIGAADVVPIVPLEAGDMGRAHACASVLGKRIGELGLPVFLYEPPARGPAFYRRGGADELARRLAARELEPDFGPGELHPSAGAVIVGARPPLIAFNVNLRGSLETAKAIAAEVREHDGGGFRGVRALGLNLGEAGHVQVSMNIEDWGSALPADILAFIEQRADVIGPELVGLIPRAAAVGLEVSSDRILENRLRV